LTDKVQITCLSSGWSEPKIYENEGKLEKNP
jgi:hypothetical protein